MNAIEADWLHSYAMLALRIDRSAAAANTTGLVLIYRGPDEWRDAVVREAPRPPERLVEDAEHLLDSLQGRRAPRGLHHPRAVHDSRGTHHPEGRQVSQERLFEAPRGDYLAGQVRALRAVARRMRGDEMPLREYVAETLGIDPEPLPESLFEAAHAELDRALPAARGTLAERMRAWQAKHTLDRIERLPDLVGQAVAETRARTAAIVPLPDGEVVDCRLESGVPYHAAGEHQGGLRSTIHINCDIPFNLADLLYVVAHEGHPGHVCESLLKEIHLVGAGRMEQQVRFLLSPQGVLSEGLGLVAEELVFPGDQAQKWLEDNVIEADGSDIAAIHHAKNVLWGVWANAAHMTAEGRPDREVEDYLARWGLLSETEAGRALAILKVPGGNPYIFAYYNGWRLVRNWLEAPDRAARVRRLLTEQLVPADLV